MSWAVVAGVSAGTGAAIARAAARSADLDVFGVHRGHHLTGALEVRNSIEAAGRVAHLRVAEGGTYEGVQEAAEELLAVAGPKSVKLFVHSLACASVARLVTGPGFQPAHPKQFTKTFDAMAHSFVWWAQALYDRNLLAPSARLIALSNPMEDQILRGTALIAAAKGALNAYVRHMAHELGPKGHKVNLVRFGAVGTHALNTTIGARYADYHQQVVAAGVPARRLVTVEEVAEFIAALTKDSHGWFNGANIDFTGGETQGLLDLLVFGPDLEPTDE